MLKAGRNASALGKKGTGYQATGIVDMEGFNNAMQMDHEGVRGRLGALLGIMPPADLFQAVLDIVMQRKTEGDVALETEMNYLKHHLCSSDVMESNFKAPGYRAAVVKEHEGMLPRSLESYYQEARQKDWSQGLPRKAPVKVYFSGGANILRRSNMPQYYKTFIWDEMQCIVDINPKYSFTGTQSDYILPAAGWYEKAGIKYTMSYVPYLHYCDVAVPPLGESKGEWEIFWLLTREMERYAKEKNLPVLDGCGRGSNDFKTLHQRYSNQGELGQHDDEKVMKEILHGDATEGMTIEGLKQTGIAKFTSAGKPVAADAINNPDWKGEGVMTTLTRFTVHKEPWPTYSGRITSFIDHPWFIEMREQFPIDAERVGVKDFEYVEIFNNYGSVRMRVKVAAMVRPGVAYYYHAWEPHQFPNHQSFKWLIPGLVNPLYMAGGYGQINHAMNRYQPGSAVQDTRIGIRPWHGQATGAHPVKRPEAAATSK